MVANDSGDYVTVNRVILFIDLGMFYDSYIKYYYSKESLLKVGNCSNGEIYLSKFLNKVRRG